MSSKWSFGIVNIFVREYKPSTEVKRSEIIPLDSAGSSVYHYFGSGGVHYDITGIVIGESNKNTLISDAQNDTPRTFTTPWMTVSNAKINGKPEFEAVMYSGAEIDGSSYDVETTPLYTVTLEIIA